MEYEKMNKETKTAYEKAGYREKFAMEHGEKKVVEAAGHRCLQFTYSEDLEYQDANGATFDTVRKEWVD